ncbi:MAG: hypothetical protein ACREHD_02285, partial [Pirellulales bacterium]
NNMLTIQRRKYSLADGRQVDIAFFRDASRFRHTLTDHVLNPNEPWHRLLKVKFLNDVRQKMDAGDVSVLEGAYDRCVAVFDEGIVFSIGLPVYVEFCQERRPMTGSSAYVSKGFYFLSSAGFLMVVRDDPTAGFLVRTARFNTGFKGPNQSKATLFHNAWQYIKKHSHSSYPDTKDGEDVRHLSAVMVSPQNWDRCPI